MGACIPYYRLYDDPNLKAWKYLFEALQLRRKEVGKLHDIFKQVDRDHSGSIGVKELLDHLQIEKSIFRDRIFSIFDEDGSGQIDFKEFVLSLWNYCTLSKATLEMFAFDLYDVSSAGHLDGENIIMMLRDLYGPEYTSNTQSLKIIGELRASKKPMDIEQFRIFVQSHTSVLFPAFRLQLLLREKVIGLYFWERVSDRRVEITKGRYVSVSKFLELNVDKKMFQNEIEMVSRMESLSKNAKHIIENTGTYHYRNQKAKNGASIDSDHQELSQLKFSHTATPIEFHQTKDRTKPSPLDINTNIHDGTVVPVATKMAGEDVIIQEILHHRSHQKASAPTSPNNHGKSFHLFQTDLKETSKRKGGNEDSRRRPTYESSPNKAAMIESARSPQTSKRKAGNDDSKRRPTYENSPTKSSVENAKSPRHDKNSTHSTHSSHNNSSHAMSPRHDKISTHSAHNNSNHTNT